MNESATLACWYGKSAGAGDQKGVPQRPSPSACLFLLLL